MIPQMQNYKPIRQFGKIRKELIHFARCTLAMLIRADLAQVALAANPSSGLLAPLKTTN